MVSTVRIGLFKVFVAQLLLSFSLLWATPVVNFKGSMSVNQGTFNYTVDLQLPPGVAGVVPKLSLLYSTNGGNGYLGQGWNLTGLSSITRCGSTIAEDGKNIPVSLDERDHYCLDGQRLIAVSGTEGEVGTEYRTKIESFSKIVSYGGTTGNPEKFKVWTKSGDVYEYGFTDDSKFTHEGKHVSWKLNRIKDALGENVDNSIEFIYDEHAISSVVYAKGINKINFNYTTTRKDTRKTNFRGQIITQDRELASIDIVVNNNTDRQYKFEYYTQSSSHDKLKLKSMTECRDSECLEPLSFEWETYDHENPSFSYHATNINTDLSYKMQVADFNGDGYSDFIRVKDSSMDIRLNDHNENFVTSYTIENGGDLDHVKLVDIDNDGDIDVYKVRDGADKIWLNNGDGTQFTLSTVRPEVNSWGKNTFFVDADNDGDIDIYESHDTYDYIWINDGTGAFPQKLSVSIKVPERIGYVSPWIALEKEQNHVTFYDIDNDGQNELFMIIPLTRSIMNYSYMVNIYKLVGNEYVLYRENITGTKLYSSNYDEIIEHTKYEDLAQFADLNGDGVPDVVYAALDTLESSTFPGTLMKTSAVTLSDGQGGWTTHKTGISALKRDVKVADINADGVADIYVIIDGKDEMWLNDGKGNFTKTVIPVDIGSGYKSIDLVDIDGDGAVDILKKANPSTGWINSGVGAFSPYSLGIYFTYTDEHFNALYGDFNGDGMMDIFETQRGLYYNDTKIEKITKVTDSFKNATKITYAPLTDDSIYTKGTDAVVNEVDVQLATEVVSQTSVGDGLGGEQIKSYHYSGLKYHRFRGSLGFQTIEVIDETTGGRIITHYEQSYPLTGTVLWTKTYLGEELLGKTSVSLNLYTPDGISKVEQDGLIFDENVQVNSSAYGQQTYLFEQSVQTQTNYMENIMLKQVTTYYSKYDEYGNVGVVRSVTEDNENNVFTKTTTSTYDNFADSGQWILGRLVSAEVKHEGYNTEITRKSSFTYNDHGMLESETIEPNNALELTKTYTYDNYGNKIKETLSSPSLNEPRTTEYIYDENAQFIKTVKNTLGHEEHRVYDQKSGNLLSVTGPNGLTTTWEYNLWDQNIKEIRADGTTTSWEYTFDASVNNSYYAITQIESSGQVGTLYHDSFDRDVATKTIGFDGEAVFVETVYNHKGEKEKKSSPYKTGETKSYIVYTYDQYGRTIRTQTPATEGQTAVTTIAYEGYRVTTTDAEGRTKTVLKNAMDKVVSIEEGDSSMEYFYDAVGNLVKTVPNFDITHAITMEYDIIGNKVAMTDPNMGHWTYSYNALGQLVSQTDAKLQMTTISYDKLGRVVSKTTPEGTHTWQYDNAANAIGKLVQENTADGGFIKKYTYDTFGRASSVTTVIDGKSYTETYAYNDKGQVESVTKPDNFKLINVYTQNGYLEAIKSPAEQIIDFDFEHYIGLISQQLQDALEYHQKYLEYQSEAARLKAQAEEYQAIADANEAFKQEFEGYAAELRSAADQYIYYATLNEGYANDAKAQADQYQALADQYLNSWVWLQSQGEFYQQLADEYYAYEEEYRALSAQYLQQAQDALLEAQSYDEQAQSSALLAEEYLTLAQSTQQLLAAAQQQADYYKQLYDQTEDARNISQAYNEVLGDSEYVYHYKVLEMDSYGRVTKYLSGNGLINTDIYDESGAMLSSHTGFLGDDAIRDITYEYDLTHNVTQYNDKYLGVTSHYAYDTLSRIENVNFTFENAQGITGMDNMNYAYDAFGNLTHKSDIGDYEYDPQHPNRLTRVFNPETGMAKLFEYDANGNMVYDDETIIEYNSANKATRIKTGTADIHFAYDMNNNRYKKTQGNTVTHYVGKSYEYIDNGNGNTVHRHLIYANGKVVAINTESYTPEAAVPTASIRYLHYDALGSVDTITDNKGMVIERRAYKPFGEELKVYKSAEAGETTNRGFTGHEHIEGTRLVHMNARLYDPTIGRFLSADPIIQDPYDTQAFNRYSYVRNNPLKYTDPSGHSWLSKVFKVIVGIIAAVVAYALLGPAGNFVYNYIGLVFGPATLAAMKVGAVFGAVMGAGGAMISGGSFKDILTGALKGALFGAISAGVASGIGDWAGTLEGVKDGHALSFFTEGKFGAALAKATVHGLSRGIITAAQGGKFGAGFASGFISSGFAVGKDTFGKGAVAARTAVMAVVGGVTSQITGGKFANGAITGAFVHLFNAEIGYRPLRGMEKIGVIGRAGSQADDDNNIVGHQHIFFDDDGTNIGYGGQGMIKNEDRSEYSQMKYYDDKVLHQAVNNIGDWKGDDYSFWWSDHNCQDYVNTVVNEYYRLGGK